MWEIGTAEGAIGIHGDREYVVGSHVSADVVVPGRRVSRRHCGVTVTDDGWLVRDLGSSNGTFVDGRRITEERGTGPVTVCLGDPDGVACELRPATRTGVPPRTPDVADAAPDPPETTLVEGPYDAARPTAAPAVDLPGPATDEVAATAYGIPLTGRHRLGPVLRVGRDPRNDVVLDDLMVSRFHAHVRAEEGRAEVIDLGSANGTFLNGRRVQRAWLTQGDVVGIARTMLLFDGVSLRQYDEPGGLEFRAEHLTVEVGSGSGRKTLLHDVGFRMAPRSLLAVIGPSGAGKSTMLGALTGQRPATEGSVFYAGRDLYVEYDELRHRIGLVPQSDLLHSQLTVERALGYGAALRFPKDTTKEERSARVEEVMDELGLTGRAGLRIDVLSGGQRKRTSVAIELLTKPSLLFLDEPTSGLDPGLDLQVMQMLRGLADEGRTVVVVTHSVANLNGCDNVMILAPGGYIAYFGPPDEAADYFGVGDYAEIFLALEQTPGEEWDRRFRASSYFERSGADAGQAAGHPGRRADLTQVKQQPFLSQLSTLARRYVAVIAADKAYLTFLGLLPLLLAVLGILVGSDDGLGSGDGGVTGAPPNYQARFVLLVLVLGAAFMGAASSVQEIVKEGTIYQRERAIGLSRWAYLLSKLSVLGIITGVQAVVFAALSLAGRPGPEEALVMGNGTLEIIALTAALAVASMALGLFLSAMIPTSEVALPVLVLVTMVQVVLSGAVPIRFDAILDAVGWLTPAYWAFSAMAATVDLAFLTAIADAPANWEHSTDVWLLGLAGMAAWVVAYVVLAYLALRRREPRRT